MERPLLDRIISLRTKFGLSVLYENNSRGYAGFIPGQDNAPEDIASLCHDAGRRSNGNRFPQSSLDVEKTRSQTVSFPNVVSNPNFEDLMNYLDEKFCRFTWYVEPLVAN